MTAAEFTEALAKLVLEARQAGIPVETIADELALILDALEE